MTDQQKISVDDIDAQFLGNLPASLTYAYYGNYQPDYITSTTIPQLNFSDTSPLSIAQDPVGFTLDGEYISALLLNCIGLDPVVIVNTLKRISKLHQLAELVLLFDSDLILNEIVLPKSLQYLEIRAPKQRVTLPDLSDLSDLSVLIVQAIVTTPPTMSMNSNIQRLVMKSTQADLFPPEIISLTRLVWLEFGSHFHSLPDSIGDLRNLVILELVSDKLVELPISIENLTKLQHLSLELESLEKLPSSFGKLSNLTDLYLWNLSWKSLPPVLFELEKLRYLWIKDNKNFQGQLEELSDDIGNLTELRDLQLNGQQLSELPDVFHLLQQLQVLKLGSNQIQSLPLSITQLSSLRRLELYFNPIKELPKALGKIEQLEHLDISDTKVTELPESFGMLQNLSVLDAVGCNLVNLPSSILNLKPEQFSQFHISLRLPRKDLSLPVKNWLCQLDQHASEVEEVSVAIELFQHETGSSQSDEVLLEENEIDAIIEGQEKLKVQFKMTLRQIFINDLAHLPLHTLLESIPMDHVYDRPSGTQHSMYDLLYHINIALQDMISYFQDPKYHPPEWPDEYWDNSDIPQSSSLPATEIIQELLEEIEEAYDFFISILDDPEHDIIDSVPSNPDHTILRQLLIFATHTSYHLGQLALLIDLFE